jgi:transposase-like protein
VKGDWDAWNARSLKDGPIVRLILDGTVVRVRLDKKATSISLLVALGVRQDGQKVLLAVKNMGGESEEAWRALLDDLVKRGLKTPELVIVDGAAGLEKALAALWSDMPVQRCTVRKHRNLLAHAPGRLHDEISADYKDMMYAGTTQEIETKRKAFIRKWSVMRLNCFRRWGKASKSSRRCSSPVSRTNPSCRNCAGDGSRFRAQRWHLEIDGTRRDLDHAILERNGIAN